MAAVFCVLIYLFLPRQGHLSARFGTLVQKLWSGRFSALHPQAFKTTLGLLHPQFSGSRQVCVCSGTLSRNICDSLPFLLPLPPLPLFFPPSPPLPLLSFSHPLFFPPSFPFSHPFHSTHSFLSPFFLPPMFPSFFPSFLPPYSKTVRNFSQCC